MFMDIWLADFNYVLKLNAANSYGSMDKAGKWNGMIGEVVNGHTHIAAGGITITAERYLMGSFKWDVRS